MMAEPASRLPVESRGMFLTGWVLTGFIRLFFWLTVARELAGFAPYVDGLMPVRVLASLAPSIGLVLLVCTIVMLIPRTAVLGCILVTGYLGGAVATQVRVNDAWFMFPAALGVMAWLGLYLRDARVRSLLPLGGRA